MKQRQRSFGCQFNSEFSSSWRIASIFHHYSHYHTCNNHLRLRQMPPTMLLVWFFLSMGIKWITTMRNFYTWSESTTLLRKKLIPLCRTTANGSITSRVRKRSSTYTTNLYSKYKLKGSCRMITIRNGLLICNSSFRTLSITMEALIMSLIASVGHWSQY